MWMLVFTLPHRACARLRDSRERAIAGKIERSGRGRAQRQRLGPAAAFILRPTASASRGEKCAGQVAPIKNGHATCMFSGVPAGNLCGRRFPCRAQRDADGDGSLRQAQAGLRLFEQTPLPPSGRRASTAPLSPTMAARSSFRLQLTY